ncbi:MAG TPA: polysaccharide deacetylase family protein [Mycobacteriales bacterium]|nr:polysaccharide deacetylase family protein [Mycobacteriales bacterium]
MNRRDFLRAGGLLATGAVASGFAGRLIPDAAQPGQPRAYAGVGESVGETPVAATDARVVWQVPTDRKLIALTLDDGPVPAYTTQYLDMLRDRKVRATFSLVGASALEHPELVKRQQSLGHQLENHSYSHLDLGKASVDVATREVVRGAEILEQLTGRRPEYFRPPRGMVSGAALAAVGRLNEDVLMWSLQLHERTKTVEQNVAHVVDNAVPGTILLAHDAKHSRIDRRIGLKALPTIIDRLRDRGYEFVTVSELVEAGRRSS